MKKTHNGCCQTDKLTIKSTEKDRLDQRLVNSNKMLLPMHNFQLTSQQEQMGLSFDQSFNAQGSM